MKTKIIFILALIVLAAAPISAQTLRTVTIDVVIPVNTAESAAAPLGSCWVAGFIVPTGWTAANIAVAASVTTTGTTYYNTQDRYGAKLIYAATANTWTVVDSPSETWGWRRIKIQSVNGSGVDVNQTGVADSTRTVTIVCR